MSTVPSAPATPQENGAPARRRKEPPERKIGPFANGVGVCVWLNQAQTDQGPRTFHTVTINPRRYFDRESNQWKDAASFNATDLPSLIYALQLAAQHCFAHPMPEQENGEAQPAAPGDDIPF